VCGKSRDAGSEENGGKRGSKDKQHLRARGFLARPRQQQQQRAVPTKATPNRCLRHAQGTQDLTTTSNPNRTNLWNRESDSRSREHQRL